MKKLLPSLLLCSLAFALQGCGGDYNANPYVCDNSFSGDDVIVEGDNACFSGNTGTSGSNTNSNSNSYIEAQLTAIQSKLWQSQCSNSQITEMTYTRNRRVSTICTFNDANCTTRSTAEPTTITESFTASSTQADSSGETAVRIQLTNIASSAVVDNVFFVDNTRLYVGTSALDFNNPFFSISASSSVSNR